MIKKTQHQRPLDTIPVEESGNKPGYVNVDRPQYGWLDSWIKSSPEARELGIKTVPDFIRVVISSCRMLAARGYTIIDILDVYSRIEHHDRGGDPK